MKFARYLLYGVCISCVNQGFAAFTGDDLVELTQAVAQLKLGSEESIAELKAEIEKLKEAIANGQSSPELEAKITAIQAAVDELKSVATEAVIAELKAEIEKLKAAVEAAKSSPDLEAAIGTIQAEIEGLKAAVEAAKSSPELEALKAAVEAAKSSPDLEATIGTIQAEIEKLKAAAANNETSSLSQWNTGKMEESLVFLRGEVAKNSARLSNLEGKNSTSIPRNANDLIGAIRDGKSLGTFISGIPQTEMVNMEKSIKTGVLTPNDRKKLTAWLKSNAVPYFPQATFYGVNEAFRNFTLILYLILQYRSGINASLEEVLKGPVNEIDLDLAAHVRMMVEQGATVNDIKQYVTLVFGGNPSKVIKPIVASASEMQFGNTQISQAMGGNTPYTMQQQFGSNVMNGQNPQQFGSNGMNGQNPQQQQFGSNGMNGQNPQQFGSNVMNGQNPQQFGSNVMNGQNPQQQQFGSNGMNGQNPQQQFGSNVMNGQNPQQQQQFGSNGQNQQQQQFGSNVMNGQNPQQQQFGSNGMNGQNPQQQQQFGSNGMNGQNPQQQFRPNVMNGQNPQQQQFGSNGMNGQNPQQQQFGSNVMNGQNPQQQQFGSNGQNQQQQQFGSNVVNSGQQNVVNTQQMQVNKDGNELVLIDATNAQYVKVNKAQFTPIIKEVQIGKIKVQPINEQVAQILNVLK
ncbi:MAG: hypothetical protein LBJ92_02000 [Holosporales bacterium]|nr:hypothetical protein [Holosporales bacterium]